MRKTTNDELGRLSAEEYAAAPKCPVAVVLDNVRSMNNVGSFFRTCDAFAVGRLCLCGITATPPSRDIHKTALGAELTVPWTYFADTADAVAALRADGYRILCVEQAEGSVYSSDGLRNPESGTRWYSATRSTECSNAWPICATGPSRYLRAEPSTRSTFPWRPASCCGRPTAGGWHRANKSAKDCSLPIIILNLSGIKTKKPCRQTAKRGW